MQSLSDQFKANLLRHRLVKPGEHLVVAVSGGADSVALLHLLADTTPECRLTAVHVDHQLRPGETENERRLVEDHCHRLQVDCQVVAVDVPSAQRGSGESLEACARRLRYEILENIRRDRGADLIAVGHTSDDQEEEVLIRLIRGTGLRGLAGMARRNGQIIRPLLDIGKAQILAYLASRNISFGIDSSNFSRRFLRNRVRLDLLPLLEQDFNPAIRRTLRSMAKVFSAEDDFLDQQVDLIYTTLVRSEDVERARGDTGDVHLEIGPFLGLHPALQRRILERACWHSGCRPTFLHIQELLACLHRGAPGAQLHLPNRVTARKLGQTLTFQHRNTQHGSSMTEDFGPPLLLSEEGAYRVPSLSAVIGLKRYDQHPQGGPGDLVVDADQAPWPLTLRSPEAGERFSPLGAPGGKKVLRFFTDRKIPKHDRWRYPVLCAAGTVIAIPGVAIAESVKVSPQTRRFLLIRWSASP